MRPNERPLPKFPPGYPDDAKKVLLKYYTDDYPEESASPEVMPAVSAALTLITAMSYPEFDPGGEIKQRCLQQINQFDL